MPKRMNAAVTPAKGDNTALNGDVNNRAFWLDAKGEPKWLNVGLDQVSPETRADLEQILAYRKAIAALEAKVKTRMGATLGFPVIASFKRLTWAPAQIGFTRDWGPSTSEKKSNLPSFKF